MASTLPDQMPLLPWQSGPVTKRRRIKNPVLAFLGAALLLVTVPIAVEAARPAAAPSTERLIEARNVTQEESFLAEQPDGLKKRAHMLSAAGGGQLVGVVAAGNAGQQVGAIISLRVEVDGEREHDAPTRASTVDKRLDTLQMEMEKATPSGADRSLTGLLVGVAGVLGRGPNTVWLETFGMPTAGGEDTRKLTATDPGAAAASVPASTIPQLPRTVMHIVLLAPAGDQPALNAATALWREQFVTALVKRTGAIVADVTTDTQPAAPPVTAPHAPPVPNIEINTPTPSGPVTPGPDHPISLPIDTALFQPDTAEWAVDLDTVKADLAPIVAAWQAAHGDIVIMVSGHCARFGGRAGAITLSKQRAAKVADVVRSLGVTVDPSNVTGIGFDAPQPYPQDPMSYKNRAVLVVARTE